LATFVNRVDNIADLQITSNFD